MHLKATNFLTPQIFSADKLLKMQNVLKAFTLLSFLRPH